MNLRELNYNIDMDGISPGVEQFGGTQGDHRVTKLNFVFSDKFNQEIDELGAEGDRLMYRVDVYDGEGGIWQSEPKELIDNTVSVELEERHTRFGGKITVYLVIAALSQDNKTQVELYCFPVVLQLKNRPEGVYQEGENYESILGLAEITKQKAVEAGAAVAAAEKTKKELEEIAAAVEEKLKNGEFDGVGVQSTQIINDELIITYTDDTSQNLGNVKGEQGVKGEKGDKGDTGANGKDAVIDQIFNSQSENAQSGKAVGGQLAIFDNRIQEALNYGIRVEHRLDNYYTKTEIDNLDCVKYIYYEDNELNLINDADSSVTIGGTIYLSAPGGIDVDRSSIKNVAAPEDDTDAANKKYVDDAVAEKLGDIESLLGGI